MHDGVAYPASGKVLARLALYAIFVCGGLELVVLAQKGSVANSLLTEGRYVEWAQVGLLVLASLILVLAGLCIAPLRQLSWILAFFPLMAAVRELDNTLDKLVGKGGWGAICGFLLLIAVSLAVRWRSELSNQWRRFVVSRAFGYQAMAFLMVIGISRIIGQNTFWKALMGPNDYTRDVPRAVEEIGELAGYLLLVCGSLELLLSAELRSVPAQVEPAAEVEELVEV